MKFVVLGLAVFFVLTTVLPFLRTTAWWIRIFDFPRVQISLASVLVLVVYVVFWDASSLAETALLVLLGLSVLYQLYRIFPYTPAGPKQVARSPHGPSDHSFRLLISNVLEDNRDAGPLLALARDTDPDLILTVETNHWWEEQLRPLDDAYAHYVKRPIDNTYGMLLFSRLPLLDPAVRFITEEGVPSIFTTVELPSGTHIRLVCLHPRPPRPDKLQDTDQRDAELLLVARELQSDDGPVVVAGDFNDVAWSDTTRLFQRISGLLDPRRGRGFYNSFNANHAWLRYPLDHVFHSAHFRLIRLERLGHIGSDHFPVLVELSYETDGPARQAEPRADAEEEREAEERIDDGLDGLKEKKDPGDAEVKK